VITLMMLLPAVGTFASLGASSGMEIIFSASKTKAYVGEKILFTVEIKDSKVTSLTSHRYRYFYRFDFGDNQHVVGYTDDGEVNITHSYNSAGTYNAKVYVRNQQTGEYKEKWLSSPIKVYDNNKAPVAKIKTSSNNVKVGEIIRFDGSKSRDIDGYIKSYIWSFGDGKKGSGKIVTHTYNSAGRYTVKLTVTDNKGKRDTETKTITVEDDKPSPPSFSVSLSVSKTKVDVGEKIVFTATIQNGNGGVTTLASHQYKYYYRFDFGDSKHVVGYSDGDESVRAVHSYSSPGKYTAKVTVIDRATESSKTDETVVNVKGNAGNQPPVADAGGPYNQKSRLVAFDASKSFDSDGKIVSYSWDFGDGRHVRNWRYPRIMHMYRSEGVYTVKLTVKDNKGAKDTDVTTVTIGNTNNGGGNGNSGGDLSVSLTVKPVNVEAMDPITCTIVIGDNSVSPPHVNVVSTNGVTTLLSENGRYNYKIVFGDGKYLAGSTDDTRIVVQHAYHNQGRYTVYVIVEDKETGDHSESKHISVNVNAKPNMAPIALAGSFYQGVVGKPVVFDASSSYDPDGKSLWYRWDFDDDGVWDTSWITSKKVKHVYLTAFEGYVRLEVKDVYGVTDTGSARVVITLGITGDVDQSQEKSDGYVKIYENHYFAQSFKPSKCKLTGLDIYIGRKGFTSEETDSNGDDGAVSALGGG
ncbi:MAG TPA: PKD domain-containing protein, partial [Thermoplasmatales archaeon]|nr:PKD domain-containing protein [Thermoplasmatales archaeon]